MNILRCLPSPLNLYEQIRALSESENYYFFSPEDENGLASATLNYGDGCGFEMVFSDDFALLILEDTESIMSNRRTENLMSGIPEDKVHYLDRLTFVKTFSGNIFFSSIYVWDGSQWVHTYGKDDSESDLWVLKDFISTI